MIIRLCYYVVWDQPLCGDKNETECKEEEENVDENEDEEEEEEEKSL